MTGVYRLASLPIRIESIYEAVHKLCADYRTEDMYRLAVHTTAKDIAFEREKATREQAFEGREIISWPDDYLETLAVYRKIAEQMPDYDTCLLHGSCVAVDGAGYLFTAKSGTGKSTHTRLWRELFGERAIMVNDDKPLIRIDANGTAVAYGTPWDGKHHLSSNISVPLRAVCVLERSAENHIREITPSEALPMLLQQVYRPMNAAAMSRTLTLIHRLTGCAKLYRLGCNMNIEAAQVAYEAMKGG